MEVKINKEIRNYKESIFFGLNLRQFICSCLACIFSISTYFLLKNKINTEIASWFCLIVSSPFIFLGFFNYNGMKAEEFFWAWLKSEFLIPKKLTFKPTNFYYELLKENGGKKC